MTRLVVGVLWVLYGSPWAGAATSATAEAERLAAEALGDCAAAPESGLAKARRALALTADFEPTAFVEAGRKGEVVEDAYLAAREAYRRHRARLYHAVGECQARGGRPDAAARYLGRAVDLDGSSGAAAGLARALVALGRPVEALDAALGRGSSLSPEALGAAEQAVDAAGLPSLQAELDRVRLSARGVAHRGGALRLSDRARLSTGAPFRLDGALTLVYVAEPSCRTCSADLESLRRLAPQDARVVVVPIEAGRDEALRGVLRLYRYDWPVGLGPRLGASFDAPAPALLVVGRSGWSAAVLPSPFGDALPGVLEAFARTDVREALPRAAWRGRPVERPAARPRPALTAEGLAPGEDEPAPEAFGRALAAFRGGRPAEALQLFDALAAAGDGWLLPPEARLDRALCLAALGRREEARRLLLRTGDSRFQDAVDRALEAVGASPRH